MKKTATRKRSSPKRKLPLRHGVIVTDSEGGLPLPVKWVREMKLKIGDEFASWKEDENIVLVFTKNYHGTRKIPKDAYRGKVEPALPEITVALPKPGKGAKVKRLKAQRGKHAEEMV